METPIWKDRMEALHVAGEKFMEKSKKKEENLTQRLGALDMLSSHKHGKMSTQKEKTLPIQIRNNADGFVFQVTDLTRVRRFLILGTDGGTFYSSEKTLRMDNLASMIEIIDNGEAHMILTEVREISVAGRNPRQDPLMFLLALCARYRVCDVNGKKEDEKPVTTLYKNYLNAMHRAALSIVNDCCRIPTHLFQFVDYCQVVAEATAGNKSRKSSGWGRSMRDTICRWYASKTPDQLAMAVTKYGKRAGWSHRDLFRLSHPKIEIDPNDVSLLELEQIYRFIVKGDLNVRKRKLPNDELIEAKKKYTDEQIEKEYHSKSLAMIETIKSLNKESSVRTVVDAIETHGLVREHIPTEHLNSVPIWVALLEKMPMTALIRNLGKMESIEMFTKERVDLVVEKLTNPDAIKASKVHPIQVLLAHEIYSAGHGDKGGLHWRPSPTIIKALEKAFYLSFHNVVPTGKRLCFAFDVSGSMNTQIMGTCLTARRASVAMGMVALRSERDVEVTAFCDKLTVIPFDKSWGLEETCKYFDRLRFGATDCAQPMLWAAETKKKFDCFCVFTDNETWYGKVHPYQALRDYRKSSGIHDAKLIVFGMTSTNFTIADPSDPGMLDVCGFDSALPEIMASFIKGEI